MNIKDRLIYALDQDNKHDILQAIKTVGPHVRWIKLNSAIFEIGDIDALLRQIRDETDAKIFLDMKWHDIPRTVARNGRWATRMEINMFTIHASGGHDMMKATKDACVNEATETDKTAPTILAITALTSLNSKNLSEINPASDYILRNSYVTKLTKLAEKSGIDGVVASVYEISLIRATTSPTFSIIVPGIRFADKGNDDQKNVGTPMAAMELGADMIVMGTNLIEGGVSAVNRALEEMEEGLANKRKT